MVVGECGLLFIICFFLNLYEVFLFIIVRLFLLQYRNRYAVFIFLIGNYFFYNT